MGEEQDQTFLERLYHHEQTKTLPVVDLAFVEALEALLLEDQYKAMQYIKFIQYSPHGEDFQQEIYKDRLQCLFDAWCRDQTYGWVQKFYDPPTQISDFVSGKGELEEVYTTQKEAGA